MRKWLGMAVAGLVALACAAGAQAETKYALCVGINKYTLSGCSTLSGCVNDSAYFYTNLVQRGGWLPANMTKLNDSKATKTAIRQAISNYAAKAQSGDVFIYQHSSHGDSGLLCTYNAEYKKAEPTCAASPAASRSSSSWTPATRVRSSRAAPPAGPTSTAGTSPAK